MKQHLNDSENECFLPFIAFKERWSILPFLPDSAYFTPSAFICTRWRQVSKSFPLGNFQIFVKFCMSDLGHNISYCNIIIYISCPSMFGKKDFHWNRLVVLICHTHLIWNNQNSVGPQLAFQQFQVLTSFEPEKNSHTWTHPKPATSLHKSSSFLHLPNPLNCGIKFSRVSLVGHTLVTSKHYYKIMRTANDQSLSYLEIVHASKYDIKNFKMNID